ncbi:MAG: 3-ketoacyl-ACP reductase [Candidatus Omnitrophica bacterium]|nr:3-ketoacyl-ACP reductase [Candidatus Omnitrophota bacterium]
MKDCKPSALVTGASRGIGKGIAIGLAAEGYTVAVNYVRNRDAAEQVLKEIEEIGGECQLVQGDVGDAGDRQRMVEETVDRLGKIDLLVNNAGIAPKIRVEILETTEESFDHVLGTNLKAPYFLTQDVAKRMIEWKNSGAIDTPRIVFVTSISAYAGSRNRTEYCISKAGASMAAMSFAMRLAEEGIMVFEIRPGLTKTDMVEKVQEKYDRLIAEGVIPQRRWGYPEDISKVVRAIGRGDLDFSTGEIIEVAGGYGLKEL